MFDYVSLTVSVHLPFVPFQLVSLQINVYGIGYWVFPPYDRTTLLHTFVLG